MEESDAQQVPTSNITIDDLPNELLLRVIQSIDRKSIRNATQVSKKWHSIIDEMVGRKLFVGRQCQIVPQDEDRYVHTYVDISEIGNLGVYECYIGEVPEPSRSMTLWSRLFSKIKKTLFNESRDPEFKYPHLVKYLHFDGPIPVQYFESVLKNVVNLSKLELHMTAFCSLHSGSVKGLGNKFKHLEDLNIWGYKLTDGLFTDFYDSKSIIPNILTFLTNDFRALKVFALEYPFDVRDDRQLTRQTFSFLRRHKMTLTKMKVSINIHISEDSSEFDSFEDREWIREARAISKSLRLKSVELIVSSMRKVRLTKAWTAFAEQHRELETATILSFRIPQSLLTSLCENNSASLKKLYVSRISMTTINRPQTVDASLFASCVKLTHLKLEGMLNNATVEGFRSTRALPKTLVELELGGMLLLHNDARDLFFELPNLRTICLTDIGNRGQFGLPIESLQQVILERRIALVTLYRCVCGAYPELGIPNGNPNSNNVIRLRPYEILEMKLSNEGYYENTYRNDIFQVLEEEEAN